MTDQPDTAVVPMVVVPVELIRRALHDAAQRAIWLNYSAEGTTAQRENAKLREDLCDALAAQ